MLSVSYQLPSSAVMVISIAFGDRKASRVVSQINHWLAASGPEWTVGRLKAVRTAALQLRAGNRALVREIYRSNSIAYRHGTLIPRGPMGMVVEAFVQAMQPAAVRRWDAVLRCYTAIRLPRVSTAQLEKAKRTITSDFTGNKADVVHLSNLLQGVGKILARGVSKPREPNIQRLKMFTSTFARCGGRPFPPDQPYGRLVWSLVTEGRWPEHVARARTIALSQDGKSDYVRQVRAILYEDGLLDLTFSGKITVIQEAGCKARVVATPTAYTQWLFEPLHQVLMGLTEQMKESCVTDQVKGAYRIQEWLAEGRTVYCFDLSSATDRFPREPQLALLRGLGLSDYASDLDELCHKWSAPRESGDASWDYKVGTPMGLYGVFPLFHLSHLVTIRIVGLLKRRKAEDCTVVLGDDVAIADPDIADAYLGVMRSLGVDISDAKTISSDHLAEFAGFVVHATNQGISAYRPYKYGSSGGIHAPLNLIHSLGKSVRRLGPKWARWFAKYQETKGWREPDLSPLVPIDREQGVRPSVLDPARLENLMSSACAAEDIFWLKEPGGQWSEEPEGYLYQLRGACEQLLDQQPLTDGNRELLSTPHVCEREDAHAPVEKSLLADPLMRATQPLTSLLKTSMEEMPPDPDDLAETGSTECTSARDGPLSTALKLLDLR